MKSRTLLLTLLLSAATLVTLDAQEEGSPATAEAIATLRRDLPLLESLVDEALELATAADALARAELANQLAERLAQELGAAMVQDDLPRVAELGRQIEATFVNAVAGNLRRAGPQTNALRQDDVQRVREQALRISHTVQYELGRLPRGTHAELDRLGRALPEASAAIDRASKAADSGKR